MRPILRDQWSPTSAAPTSSLKTPRPCQTMLQNEASVRAGSRWVWITCTPVPLM